MANRNRYVVGKVTVTGLYTGRVSEFHFLTTTELAAVKLAAPAAEKYRKMGLDANGCVQYLALGSSGAVQTVVTVRRED